MIITNKSKTGQSSPRSTRSRLLAGVLITVVLAALVGVMIFSAKRSTSSNNVHCNAEQVRGDRFYNDGHFFSNGPLQSNLQAHSGKFSCRVPKSQGAQFGFGYTWKPTPGTAYIASVWRFKNPLQEGKLVVKGEGKLYSETDEVVDQSNGWEKLVIHFNIPFGQPLSTVQVYVYTNGYQDVFFDDLEIKEVGHWSAADFQPEELQLDIPPKEWKKLVEARQKALRNGILEAEEGAWAEGVIFDSTGNKIPVKIRLKGDWLDHLQGEKWSFRITVEPPYSWNRMVTFSVHTPSTRYYLHEWLLHQLFEKEDIITTRYDFVTLKVNGKSLGIYAYEEHFEKEVVEYRHRREGPIMKFSEEGFWSGIKRQLGNQGYVSYDAGHAAMDRYNAEINAFKQGKIEGSPTLSQEYNQAFILMTQYRFGLKQPGEVFDIERLAKYFALCDVVGGHHGIIWHNQRFYFNPITQKLEPIGFDGFGESPKQNASLMGEAAFQPGSLLENDLVGNLFCDSVFTEQYVKYLFRFSTPGYLQPRLDSLQNAWAPRLQWVQAEFPDYQSSLSDFSNYALLVHSLVLPYSNLSVKAFVQSTENGRQRLWVANTHTLPIEVIGYGNKFLAEKLKTPLLLPGQTSRKLLSKISNDSMIRNFDEIRFVDAQALALQTTQSGVELLVPDGTKTLFFKPLGIDTVFRAAIVPHSIPTLQSTAQELFANVDLKNNSHFSVVNTRIVFKPGKHTVDKPIIIPQGYLVVIPAGTQVDLIQKSFILTRSPVEMIGTEDSPIRFTSSDHTSQGFTVLQAQSRSKLQYVDFDGLNTLAYKNWILTGAVTFYESEGYFSHCSFRNIPSEDALNLVRSTFFAEYCEFNKTASDAFDTDFCKGEVQHCYFLNTTNDGLDLSGSIITVRDCVMDHNGDKGISVGEESDVSIFNTSVSNAVIGMASKDLSVLFVQNITLSNCDQGFAAYQKKPEFGGGRIIVDKYKSTNIRRLYAISPGSTLQLGQQLIR